MSFSEIHTADEAFANSECPGLPDLEKDHPYSFMKTARDIRTQPSTFGRVYGLILHILIITLLFLLLIPASHEPPTIPMKGRTWSPVQDVITYEMIEDTALDHKPSKYHGKPTEEQDEAWGELLKPSIFRATHDELERSGETFGNVVEMSDGGYPASLGVYHELHCLRQLRLFLFQGRYYPKNLTEVQDEYFRQHLDHCIESLRLTVMCYGNSALYTFAWRDSVSNMVVPKSNSKSTCVKWSTIEDWSSSRIAVHPNLRHSFGSIH
ncbi:hypothetical protein B0T22DRAFT_386458 [Podospora appendiculata]|uniref:Uncharacterized protein n=1 Tax=Podospora appendiculata TaxID=314037 RepID=A0AAE0X232_9PEZI|nr:hypothetical protein B0T22DRAFT_386458 [Podospora appendiculata]